MTRSVLGGSAGAKAENRKGLYLLKEPSESHSGEVGTRDHTGLQHAFFQMTHRLHSPRLGSAFRATAALWRRGDRSASSATATSCEHLSGAKNAALPSRSSKAVRSGRDRSCGTSNPCPVLTAASRQGPLPRCSVPEEAAAAGQPRKVMPPTCGSASGRF